MTFLNRLAFLSLLCGALLSCSDLEIAEPAVPVDEDEAAVDDTVISEPSAGTDFFYAYIEKEEEAGDASETAETKTALISDPVTSGKKVIWSEEDKVTLVATSLSDGVYSTGFYDYVTLDADGKFSNVDEAVPDWSKVAKVTAFYPADDNIALYEDTSTDDPSVKRIYTVIPSIQNYSEVSFGAGAYPMVAEYVPSDTAVSSYPSMLFKPMFGVFRLKLKSSDAISVASVGLTVSNTPISGKFEYSGGELVYAGEGDEADNTVTLICGDSNGSGIQLSADEYTEFNFALPAAEYDSFKISIRTTDNKFRAFKLKSGSKVLIEKSTISELPLNATGFGVKYEVVSEETLTYDNVTSRMFTKATELENLYESYLFVGQVGLSTFDIEDYPDSKSNVSYKSIVLNYATVDPQGREVWASGRVYMSYNTENKAYVAPGHIVLCSHYTIGASYEAPSEYDTFDMGLVLQGGLVVAPDYVGYGNSEGLDHPYLCRDITAINALDMVRAAKAYFATQGVTIDDSISLYNLGYSQGGGSALAIARYIEVNNLTDKFNLIKTSCGAGVYSPELFWDSVTGSSCAYPGGLPLIIIGLKTAYPDIMKAPLEKYFSDKVVSGGVIEAVRAKDKAVDEIASVIATAVGKSSDSLLASDILSADALDSSKDLYKQIRLGLQRNEILTDDWTAPKTKFYFLHYDEDETVPYAMMTAAQSHFTSIDATFDTFEGASSVIKVLSSNAKNLESHRGTAGLFYARCWGGKYL